MFVSDKCFLFGNVRSIFCPQSPFLVRYVLWRGKKPWLESIFIYCLFSFCMMMMMRNCALRKPRSPWVPLSASPTWPMALQFLHFKVCVEAVGHGRMLKDPCQAWFKQLHWMTGQVLGGVVLQGQHLICPRVPSVIIKSPEQSNSEDHRQDLGNPNWDP